MAFCGSAPRTAQGRAHRKRSGTNVSQGFGSNGCPGTVPLDAGAEPSARRLHLTARATGYATQRHAGGATIPPVCMAKAFADRAHAILNELGYHFHIDLTN
eukprot:3244279-Pleurochrysis_carterae.AAC.1